MARTRKIVPKSKISEWLGLDRISVMVHEMHCIWREQEKDDIGIDGEIELCRPRNDGDGMIGTGKIVKVQSKSGSRYVLRDTEDAFVSPVEEKDLLYWRDLNVPAIYIVYHPDDDRLYWKHVQVYLKERPDALQPPQRIEFDKSADRFDKTAYAQLAALCELAPERILTDRCETLYTNILPVISLPKQVFVTPVVPEKQPNFHDRISGAQWIPPYSYTAGIVTTLIEPALPGTALTNVVDHSGVDTFALDDWLGQETGNDDRLRALLNSTLHRHLRRLGLEFLKTPRRYFFNKGLAEDSPIKRKWKSSRTKREQVRQVAKYYEYGKHKFYRHLAVDARFDRLSDSWGILIEPKIHFSVDGTVRWEGKTARSYAIRARSEEWNNIFLNNILFWAHQISKGQEEFFLTIDDKAVCTVSGSPLTVEAGFSIETVAPPDRKVKRD